MLVLVRCVMSLHKVAMTKIIANSELSEKFEIKVGMQQRYPAKFSNSCSH